MLLSLRYAADVLFPKTCIGCGVKGILLCNACRTTISPAPKSSVLAACSYDGLLKKIFAAIKLRNESRHVPELAELLIQMIETDAAFNDYTRGAAITFIPMHWMKKNMRGFNQSEIIAKHVAKHFGNKSVPLLKRTRYGSRQSALSRILRAKNAKGLFAYRKPKGFDIAGKRILLIDDIRTTGATLDEASRVLLAAGAADIRCAVIAQD